MKFNWKISLPIVFFLVLVALLAFGLKNDPRVVPSVLIDKPVPEFTLANLHTGEQVATEAMQGEVWVLNIWASWCAGCLEEHPYLNELSKTDLGVPWSLVGFNYKDTDLEAKAWLNKHEDPYHQIITDPSGRTGIDFGVYGVPETFVIDKKNRIRHKHIGPLTPEDIENTIIPLIKHLAAES